MKNQNPGAEIMAQIHAQQKVFAALPKSKWSVCGLRIRGHDFAPHAFLPRPSLSPARRSLLLGSYQIKRKRWERLCGSYECPHHQPPESPDVDPELQCQTCGHPEGCEKHLKKP